ncbi:MULTISPECIES: hypothetical protein [unclassified Spiroplasma]|uniref:hypothetical protein n=1 Tax=unclassified Spiroplasma TaxID=2637901 RepID=UPI00313C390C
MRHNKKVSVQNLNEKQTKINKDIQEHNDKSDARQKKRDEKAVKKTEKKKS